MKQTETKRRTCTFRKTKSLIDRVPQVNQRRRRRRSVPSSLGSENDLTNAWAHEFITGFGHKLDGINVEMISENSSER